MKGLKEIAAEIDQYVQRNLYEVAIPFPHAFSVSLPKQEALQASALEVLRNDGDLRRWADASGLQVACVRRKMGSSEELVAQVIVPDETTALRVVSNATRKMRTKALDRVKRLMEAFGGAGLGSGLTVQTSMQVVKLAKDESDVDFQLLVTAGLWFREHLGECPSLSPREVPLPGFSAKWLGSVSSSRRKAICMLLGVEPKQLHFRERPGEMRYRYLDPACADWPERLASVPSYVPEVPVSLVLVVENKDTYLAMPHLDHAVCVFGSGFAVRHLPSLLPWVTDSGLRVLYWGDLDAAGFEILSSLRQAEVDCTSLCMDRDTYEQFKEFGTQYAAPSKNGSKKLQTQVPLEGLALTAEEYELYRALCEGTLPVVRIEQERIPIPYALRRVGLEPVASPRKSAEL